MKKIYIQPAMIAVNAATQTLMITSVTGADGLGFGGNTEEAEIIEGAAKENNHSMWSNDWSE